MMRRSRLAPTLLAFAVASAAACSEGPTEPGTRTGQLPVQWFRWRSLGVVSYDFDYTYSNEWFPPRNTRVEVRDRRVTRVIDLATGDSIGPSPDSRWPTVDSLFVTADEGKHQSGTEVRVTYDAALHYPRTISVDHPQWADDAFWISTGRLRVR